MICLPCAEAASEALARGEHAHDPVVCVNVATCPCQHGDLPPSRIKPESVGQ